MPDPRPDTPSAEECVQIFHAALKKGDTEGVHAALVGLALKDPHRAQDLLDLTRIALRAASDPTLRPLLTAMLNPSTAGASDLSTNEELTERVKAGTAITGAAAVALARGLLEIAEQAMPDTYFATDSRCLLARAVLEAEGQEAP
jgi:hypothetical protein